MVYTHEIISYPDNLPLKLFIHSIGKVEKHWHESLELLILIDGTATITVGDISTTLSTEDVFLVNANQIHDLSSEGATLIAIQIKPQLVKNVPPEFKTTHYSCDSTSNSEQHLFSPIKNIVAKFLKLNLEGGKYIRLMNESLFFNLIYELYANFADGTQVNQEDAFKQLTRLNQIIALVNSEYDKKLSLESIAERVFVSPPYLSKLFKQSMGISISDYIKNTRLHYATNDLLYFDSSIEAIARNNGFPNTRSFVLAFKDKYGVLPSVWREENTLNSEKFIPQSKDKSVAYYESDPITTHESLSQFIESHLSGSDTVTPIKQKLYCNHRIIAGDVKQTDIHYKKFVGVSRAKELLYAPIREQLTELNKKVHFDYIKMHSILDDDMFVYSEDADGNPIYNFCYVEQVIDFIISIGIKPLVQLSFMPELLATNKNKRLFGNRIIVSEPNNIFKWCTLVHKLITHLINRYSLSVVKEWLFSVWNEPGTANELFGFNSDDIFYNLYKSTYDTVKSIDSNLIFGGPAGFSAYGKNDDWLLNFLEFAKKSDCRPDFVSTHYYDIDLSDEFFRKKDYNEIWLSPLSDSFILHFDKLKSQLSEMGYGEAPLYITEWNSTTSHKDLLSDTCFKAAYIAKNATQIASRIDGLCYWLLSDMHEENQLSPLIFHGGLGVFTQNGIRKPSYYALQFISQLGDKVIYNSNGIFATKTEDEIQILLYNYHHYSITYARDIGINVSYNDRYTVFPEKCQENIELEFADLSGRFLITEQYVNQKVGSAFDNFIRMGAIEPMTDDDRNYLRDISIPKLKKSVQNTDQLKISVSLEPFEIRLITIRNSNDEY